MEASYFLVRLSICLAGFSVQNIVGVLEENVTFEGTSLGDVTVAEESSTNTAVQETTLPTEVPKRKRTKDASHCPPLPLSRLENGEIKLLPDKRIAYACNKGFRLQGPPFTRCYKGEWTNAVAPICIVPYNSCEPPEQIPHGTVLQDQWTEGSRIMYICDPGYFLLGQRERTCENGYWNPLRPPTCQDESEALTDVATRLKEQFIDEAGIHSSDSSRGRSIGSDVEFTGLELMLLIDQSSSIDPVDFKHGIEFAKFLVEEFGVKNGKDDKSTGTRLGVITFSDNAKHVIKLTDASIRNSEDAKIKLDALKPEGGGTAIQRALMETLVETNTFRKGAKKAAFLLTDGQNNVGNSAPSVDAANLRKIGVEIFTVGIGRDINRDELTSIASEPASHHVFLLDKFSDLADIMALIRDTPTKAPPIGPEKCGFLPERKGRAFPEAVIGWPWLATIYVKHPPKEDSPISRLGICSGALICSQWVITSASCFYGEIQPNEDTKFTTAYVTLGENDLSRKDKNTQENFRVSKVVFHPKFHLWIRSDYDIALVKLKQPAPLELTYRPICLPTTERQAKDAGKDLIGTMAGWGTVPSDGFSKGHFASAFKILPEVVKMPLVRDFTCREILTRKNKNTICAGSVLQRTCSGNLGSPLILKDESLNVYYIAGILNNKKFCNTHYNTFTEVSYHLQWIINVTNSCHSVHDF